MYIQRVDRKAPAYHEERPRALNLIASGEYEEAISEPQKPKAAPIVSWTTKAARIADGILVPPELVSSCAQCGNTNFSTGPTAEKTFIYRHTLACTGKPQRVPDEVQRDYREFRTEYDKHREKVLAKAKAAADYKERLQEIQMKAAV